MHLPFIIINYYQWLIVLIKRSAYETIISFELLILVKVILSKIIFILNIRIKSTINLLLLVLLLTYLIQSRWLLNEIIELEARNFILCLSWMEAYSAHTAINRLGSIIILEKWLVNSVGGVSVRLIGIIISQLVIFLIYDIFLVLLVLIELWALGVIVIIIILVRLVHVIIILFMVITIIIPLIIVSIVSSGIIVIIIWFKVVFTLEFIVLCMRWCIELRACGSGVLRLLTEHRFIVLWDSSVGIAIKVLILVRIIIFSPAPSSLILVICLSRIISIRVISLLLA
jgi:hypothetical protein